MTTENRPLHSPLGASSAERWMNCPGSTALLKELALPETDEPDYRREGVAAHEAAAHCLNKGIDTWEIVGHKFHDTEIGVEIADAVQIYLGAVRPAMLEDDARTYVEYPISHPAHALFYGTVDCGVAYGNVLEVTDYKHGAGIAVDVENNPQIMYYAYGLLREHPETEHLRLRIVQPRIVYRDAVQCWEVPAAHVKEWAQQTLIPAMQRAEMDATLDAGPWCRFCPAKLVCPLLTSLFGAAATANPKAVVQLTDQSLGRSYQYTQAVKFYLKAMEEETFRRLNAGQMEGCGVKLVPKKANRVFKEGAADLFKAKFGAEAMTAPELKSPAEMAKIGAEAAKLVTEWAYTPQTGLTVALADDKRVAVKVQSSIEAFGSVVVK